MAMAGRFKVSECLRLSPQECPTWALFQGVTDDVKMDAGAVLVDLPLGHGGHPHFRVVVSEIWGHLKALAETSREFVFNVLISWGYNVLGLWGARVPAC